MKKRPPSIDVVRRWQHLEFFQWFSKTFDAKQVHIKNFSQADPRNVCMKTCALSLGVLYSKDRGTELLEPNGHGGWQLFRAQDYSNHRFNFDDHAPRYGKLPPDIDGRLAWWKALHLQTGGAKDLRQMTALAVALEWKAHPVHPTHRKNG